MFENHRIWETEFLGSKFVVETGQLCELSSGSCLVRWGETTVLCNATMSEKPRDNIDFFPLSVDFEEKHYAVGRIPGSFMRREARPSEKAILTSRVVDRSIRPFFPGAMRNDVAVVMTVLSVDPDYSPEIAGMIGTSIALSISDIPWNGPIGGICIGLVDDQIVFNPNYDQRKASDLYITLASTKNKVAMIEAGANEVPEETVIQAIDQGHKAMQGMIGFIEKMQTEIGKPKIVFEDKKPSKELFDKVSEMAIDKVRLALDTDDKNVRESRLKPIKQEIHLALDAQYPDQIGMIDECIYLLQKFVVRRWLLDEGKRVDGRKMDEVRSLHADVGMIPRVHGSGLFTRGQTQVLSIVTLGTIRDAQLLDGLDDEEHKRYMHHYNFPSYSVGETRPNRGPGRREIGHGALAEKALLPVIPPVEDFPYSLRLVSEVLSSNGSTSQGSVCGCTLALMDAGVPIKAPVAGISCGLITEGDRWMTMVDIQGLEDFFGDMDFKVAGTHKGITAIQVDIKNDGLSGDVIREAIEKTYAARLMILDEIMLPVIPKPREELSEYAPKMLIIKIHPDKIREVIGSGGKVIQKICADYEVKIDIEDDGSVYISSINLENATKALAVVKGIAIDPEVGAVYAGTVTRVLTFGAFVEIAPGKEGLVHISKLANSRVEKVEDVVNVGDTVEVRVLEIDDQGRVNLAMKDVTDTTPAKRSAPSGDRRPGGAPRPGGGFNRNR